MDYDRQRPPLSELSPGELRDMARDYREMAATARTEAAHGSLLRLAERIEALADRREKEPPSV